MGRAEKIIAKGNISDFESFLDENRKMVSAQFNKVLMCCILAGPFIALAIRFNIFKGVSYSTAVFISAFMAVLTLLHRLMINNGSTNVLTGLIGLVAIDVLLIVMDSAHLTIYISWFLIPLLALQFCDRRLFLASVTINYGFMVYTTWHTAPYFAERRTDISTPFAYFASRLGGLTVETIVMIAAGLALCRIMSNHYKSLIEQYKNLSEEKERSQHLQDVSDQAIAANEAKSAFLSNMSHEIRTPINAVLGMNEMILRETEDRNILSYSESIKIAGNTLLGLINDTLDFSKIEAGKIEILPVDYDLSSVINDLVNMIQTKADEKGLTLALDFNNEMPKFLNGDEVRVKQVITNILTNAVKYTEKGSVTFAIDYERAEDEPDYVYINVSVRDTGIGIKEEDMQRLFSEFERIEEKRNRNIEGTGLGMSITKRLLEMMGSSLKVESVYGTGSKFYFSLKQRVVKWEELGDYEADYKVLVNGQQKYKEKFTAPKAIILVIDDNPMNLMVFKSLLKQTRVKIDMAESGDEGLKLACDKKYDMIFFDHMMPDKDGIETLHEMRGQRSNPNVDTPSICLTANAISGARERYLSEGFDDYLTKPIDADRLEEMMMYYLPDDKVEAPSNEDYTEETIEFPEELKLLDDEDWIDVKVGLDNSGTVGAYMSLLKVFYNSLDEMSDAIEGSYADKDLKNYTIKVHGLKSSARIIGATAFGEEAQKLENACKEGDVGYIDAHHAAFMETYRSFKEPLAPLFVENEVDKPECDVNYMKDVYEKIKSAAEEMDIDKLESIVDKISDYKVPEIEVEKWNNIKDGVYKYDYDAVLACFE